MTRKASGAAHASERRRADEQDSHRKACDSRPLFVQMASEIRPGKRNSLPDGYFKAKPRAVGTTPGIIPRERRFPHRLSMRSHGSAKQTANIHRDRRAPPADTASWIFEPPQRLEADGAVPDQLQPGDQVASNCNRDASKCICDHTPPGVLRGAIQISCYRYCPFPRDTSSRAPSRENSRHRS